VKARQGGLLVLALGLLGSQAGHLLAYEARFGTAARQIQSSGAHAYFPTAAKTALGTAAAILVACLFIVALARLLSRRRPAPGPSAPSLVRLVAPLFTLQLALFALQETVEAAVSGAPAIPAATLLLWGTLGQLPVAFAAAIALRWLLARLDGAVSEIKVALSTRWETRPVLAAVPVRVGATSSIASRPISISRFERGPPPPLAR
jgi:hypothetical protein